MSRRAAMPAPDSSAKSRLRLWLKLLKKSRQIETEIRERFRQEFDTTLPRFDVLSALDRFPEGLKMSEISGVLKVSHGNVTGIVDRLVQDGLVIRSAVPGDRRALMVQLTRRGEQAFARQAAGHEGWIDELLSTLTARDMQALMRGLDKVAPERSDSAAETGAQT